MFADLDDPTPPTASPDARCRVDARARELVNADHRHRVRQRIALSVGLVLLVVVGAVLLTRAGSTSRSGVVGPDPETTTPSTAAPVVAHLTYDPTGATDDAISTTVERLNQRLAQLDNPARVVRGTPGVLDITAENPALAVTVRDLAAQRGFLQFRPVLDISDRAPTVPIAPPEQLIVAPGEDNGSMTAYYRLGPSLLDSEAIESASAGIDQREQWEIRPIFKPGADGIDLFNAAAAQCTQPSDTCPTGQLAIVLDGRVLTAPTIEQTTFERDQITISGDLREDQARQLAAIIGSGPLLVTLT